jgi:hypothetical protein
VDAIEHSSGNGGKVLGDQVGTVGIAEGAMDDSATTTDDGALNARGDYVLRVAGQDVDAAFDIGFESQATQVVDFELEGLVIGGTQEMCARVVPALPLNCQTWLKRAMLADNRASGTVPLVSCEALREVRPAPVPVKLLPVLLKVTTFP